MDNNAMKNPGFIVSILLLIGFFLPWVNVVIISFSGFDLATVPFRGVGGGEVYLALLLWLIPICTVLAIVFGLRGSGPVRGMVFIASLVVILAFIAAIIGGSSQTGDMPEGMEIGVFDIMGFGMWISLVVAVVGILVSFGIIKSRSS